MNFRTFFICKGPIFTFRVLGFGVFACHVQMPLAKSVHDSMWLMPLTPNWCFAFVGPWH